MDAIQHVPNDTKSTELSSYNINDHMMDQKDVETQIGALAVGEPQGDQENTGIVDTDTSLNHNNGSIYEGVPSVEESNRVSENIERRQEEVEPQDHEERRQEHIADDATAGLELPANIDHEDLSKLLELDTKHGDEIFGAHEILEHAMREEQEAPSGSETGDDDEEDDRTTSGKDVGANQDDDDDDDDDDDEDDDDDDDDDDESEEDDNVQGNAIDVQNEGVPEPLTGEGRREESDLLEKDGTVSPKMTASDTDDVRTSSVAAMTGEHSSRSPLKPQNFFKHDDEHSPAAILQEKGDLMGIGRHDSLTPVMFQQHEILMSQMQNQNGIDDGDGTHGEQAEDPMPLPDEQPTISAYARLDFQSFAFYVQTLHVIIGRRSENDFSHKVDVNLGPSKSTSRRHAQIFYNFGTGRFELSIIGKNGAFVDDIFVEKGNTVPLKNKTKIQIGQIPFQFVLPDQEKGEQPQKSPEPPLSAGPEELDSNVKEENESKNLLEEIGAASSIVPDTNVDLENDPALAAAHAEITRPQPIPEKPSPSPELQPLPQPQTSTLKREKERRPPKVPKKVYSLEEIPPEYRTKPTCSYSALLTECIRKYSSPKGMSLSEIYAGIRELFPYYKYCPDGWQSSVRHNLSLNKSFRKVSKEGKGWLWGLDEDYITERERQKKKQAEVAAAKAAAAQERLEQQQQQRAKRATSGSASSGSRNKYDPRHGSRQQSISQTLAANRAADRRSSKDDHQRTMKYLQEQLIILTKNRKGLSNQTIASILTQALAMTINQVTQAAKNKGISGNPLTALMDKNPQHLNLILAAAVNAATSKATNGKVKQLVNMPSASPEPPNTQIKTQIPSTQSAKPTHTNTYKPDQTGTAAKGSSSFDPTSLSKFFQPRQPTRVSPPVSSSSKPAIPQKRSHNETGDESSSSDDSSSESDDDENTDDGKKASAKDQDDDDDDEDDDDDSNTSGSSDDDKDDKDDGRKNDERFNNETQSHNEGEGNSNVLGDGGNTNINDNLV